MELVFDLEADNLLRQATKAHTLCVYDRSAKRGWRFNNQAAHPKRSGSIQDGLEHLAKAESIIGHNICKFDLPVLKKLFGWEPPSGVLIRDTLVMSRFMFTNMMDMDAGLGDMVPTRLWGWHSLESWGYRLGCRKGEFGKTSDGDSDEQAWERWTEEMEDYCVQDVVVTARLYHYLLSKEPSETAMDLEHAFARLMALQESRGFGFDVKAATALAVEVGKKRLELEAKLQSMVPPRIEEMKTPEYYYVRGDPDNRFTTKKAAREMGFSPKDVLPGPNRKKIHQFNPRSGKQVSDYLISAYKWSPTEFTPSGQPKVSEKSIEHLKYPEIPILLDFMQADKIAGMLSEGDQAWLRLETGGRIFGEINTGGAVTGRCTHKNPNVAQVPRVGSFLGEECRSLFVPSEGYQLVGWDASGLELRCLAHYMARYDGGEYGRILLESDIHTANQQAAGLPTRNDAKTFIYAFLYGAGDEKIGSIVGGGRMAGKKLRAKFLKSLPALRKLTEKVKERAKSQKFLYGLDGRRLHVRSAHSALNTLLQSAGALVMKKAALIQDAKLRELGLVWGRDYAHVANIHDEVQIEALPEYTEIVGKAGVEAIAEAGEFFGFRCPLSGEFKVGTNWANTH